MSIKKTGQVFTPDYIIDMILDTVGYVGPDIINKKIMEPSFGDGRILYKIIDRLIYACEKEGMDGYKTALVISNNIYGIELDTALYHKVITEISAYLENKLGYFKDINLYCCDTLKCYKDFNDFDFVVGNPPYVNIHNVKEREVLREFYFTKKGMSDTYLAFFQAGLNMLSDSGKLCFITPSAWMFNKSGENMRKTVSRFYDSEMLWKTPCGNSYLSKIIDFGHKQVFDGFSTYTSITLLDMNSIYNEFVEYKRYDEENYRKINYKDLWIGDRYCFDSFENVIKYRDIYATSYDGCCTVKNGYATLCDNFFIDNKEMPDNPFMIDVYKASTGEKYKCFYPYDSDGKPLPQKILMEEKDMWKYIEENKEKLLNRATDAGIPFYCFGRTQGLSETNKKKFLISSIVKNKDDIRITECPTGSGVYGGLYILPICSDCDLNFLKRVLISDDFISYVRSLGLLKNGGYYTFTSVALKKYLNYAYIKEKITIGSKVKYIFYKMKGAYEYVTVTATEETEDGLIFQAKTDDDIPVVFKIKDIGNSIEIV